jgi:aspartate/tyrosine/aromatic aminotransferase
MFDAIPSMPPDPVLGLMAEFSALSHPHKVNLGIGIYRDEQGLSLPFEAIILAEKKLQSESLSKDYLPIEGDPEYVSLASRLVLGDWAKDPTVISLQTVGGTSALNTAAKLLKQAGYDTIALPNPTWPNHPAIFKAEGLNVISYPHGDIQALKSLPKGCVVLVHAACHNPTGSDPSKKEWEAIFEAVHEIKGALLFDNAYLGFGNGLEADAWALQKAFSHPLPVIVATSFSKTFGLYGERVGLLSIKCASETESKRVLSFLKTLVRVTYSNPPLQGERLVKTILHDQGLKSLWENELQIRRERIRNIRKEFSDLFPEWEKGHGFFGMTGLSPEAIDRLKKDYGILMQSSGRVNLSGINEGNRRYVKEAFRSVL